MRIAHVCSKLEKVNEYRLAQTLRAFADGLKKDKKLEDTVKQFEKLLPMSELESLGKGLQKLAEKLNKLDKKELANDMLNYLLDALERKENKIKEKIVLQEI